MYIVIHITCDKQQTAFIILCQINIGIHPELIRVLRTISIHAILDHLLFLCRTIMCFGKPFIINVVIMITGSCNSCFIKVRIRADGCRRHKTTSRMSKNPHSRSINIRIAIGQLLDSIFIIRQRIISQVSKTIGMVIFSPHW